MHMQMHMDDGRNSKLNSKIYSPVVGAHLFVSLLVIDFVIINLCFVSTTHCSSSTPSSMDTSTAVLIRVDQSGKGDYTKIQDAIDAVPSDNSRIVYIWVKPGTYREKVVVPVDKPYITLSGTEPSNTIVTWNAGGDIFDSPTLSVMASDFVGRFITIENTHGKTRKAVALRVAGDRAAFYNCRILSYQDTLLDEAGRHYYSNCYIEGAVDFIFGDAASLYEKCHMHSIADVTGTITAQKRASPSENTGFTFLGGKVTGIKTGSTLLGRPWGAYSRVIFAYTYMSGVVSPQGWDDWRSTSKQRTAYYGEYKCSGPGANRSKRVAWSHGLTSDEASLFLSKNMIGGNAWLRPSPTHFKKGFISSSL